MSTHPNLFDRNYDITRNRHKGSVESVAANPRTRHKEQWQEKFLAYIETKLGWGATLVEICDHFGRQKNEVSPRLSELKASHKVVKNGTRSGCAVLVHAKFKHLVGGAQ
jgi:hypothetical protein